MKLAKQLIEMGISWPEDAKCAMRDSDGEIKFSNVGKGFIEKDEEFGIYLRPGGTEEGQIKSEVTDKPEIISASEYLKEKMIKAGFSLDLLNPNHLLEQLGELEVSVKESFLNFVDTISGEKVLKKSKKAKQKPPVLKQRKLSILYRDGSEYLVKNVSSLVLKDGSVKVSNVVNKNGLEVRQNVTIPFTDLDAIGFIQPQQPTIIYSFWKGEVHDKCFLYDKVKFKFEQH